MPDTDKAFYDVKAELLTSKELDAWLAGERSRRVMAVPFGGPLPGGPRGKDMDGQYFDERSDLTGPYLGLKASLSRIVDWHHDGHGVPANAQWMKGSILGRIDMDPAPSEMQYEDDVIEGIAADWWAKAGERRLALVKALAKRNQPIYGSGQALYAKASADGHIDEFPMFRWTASTSPQNTWAVIPPLKALLAADLPFDEVGLAALKAALVGLDLLSSDLRTPSDSDPGTSVAAKAGRVLSAKNEAELRQAMEALSRVLARLPEILLPDNDEDAPGAAVPVSV